MLELAGRPIPDGMQGRSLLPILSGGASPDHHRDFVRCEYYDALDQPDGTFGTMYFDGRYKLSVYHGHNLGELYDLTEDPHEFDNLWDEPDYQSLKARSDLAQFRCVDAGAGCRDRSGSDRCRTLLRTA